MKAQRGAPATAEQLARNRETAAAIGAFALGCRRTDWESWCSWAVFPASMSDDDIGAVFDLGEYYSGPGRAFSHGGYIRRTGTRALALRPGGMDV